MEWEAVVEMGSRCWDVELVSFCMMFIPADPFTAV